MRIENQKKKNQKKNFVEKIANLIPSDSIHLIVSFIARFQSTWKEEEEEEEEEKVAV